MFESSFNTPYDTTQNGHVNIIRWYNKKDKKMLKVYIDNSVCWGADIERENESLLCFNFYKLICRELYRHNIAHILHHISIFMYWYRNEQENNIDSG